MWNLKQLNSEPQSRMVVTGKRMERGIRTGGTGFSFFFER
jgi:hypothetical protein